MNTSTKQTNAAPATSGALKPGTHTLKSLLALTGHYYQPYGGGFQVFYQPGATTGDPRYWSLTDAHVVGLLSGPSLHIVTTDTAATFNASRTHTPEPWQHSADLPHHGCRLIHAADGYLVADAGRITRRTGDEMDSNARRIVACVNACEGMADPAKEIAALRAVQDEALGLRIALVDAKKQIASLRAERTASQTAARAWKDEVTALRAALEPFAELATSAKCDEMPEFAACAFVITAASMLAARKALAGKGDQ